MTEGRACHLFAKKATNLVLAITIQMPVKIQMIVEAAGQRRSVKMVFLEISQNSQESTCTRVSFLNDSGTGLFLLILSNF